VVPEASHVVDLDFDAIYHLLGILNHTVAVVEFAADVAIVTDFGFKIVNFYENGVQLLGSILTAAVVLVEVTLLHLLRVDFQVFFEFNNGVCVLASFSLDERSDFLLHVFSEFLEVGELVKEFLG